MKKRLVLIGEQHPDAKPMSSLCSPLEKIGPKIREIAPKEKTVVLVEGPLLGKRDKELLEGSALPRTPMESALSIIGKGESKAARAMKFELQGEEAVYCWVCYGGARYLPMNYAFEPIEPWVTRLLDPRPHGNLNPARAEIIALALEASGKLEPSKTRDAETFILGEFAECHRKFDELKAPYLGYPLLNHMIRRICGGDFESAIINMFDPAQIPDFAYRLALDLMKTLADVVERTSPARTGMMSERILAELANGREVVIVISGMAHIEQLARAGLDDFVKMADIGIFFTHTDELENTLKNKLAGMNIPVGTI
jgi:hypothetical protein